MIQNRLNSLFSKKNTDGKELTQTKNKGMKEAAKEKRFPSYFKEYQNTNE